MAFESWQYALVKGRHNRQQLQECLARRTGLLCRAMELLTDGEPCPESDAIEDLVADVERELSGANDV